MAGAGLVQAPGMDRRDLAVVSAVEDQHLGLGLADGGDVVGFGGVEGRHRAGLGQRGVQLALGDEVADHRHVCAHVVAQHIP